MPKALELKLFAPGKLFVLGEWAVLRGAPAVIAPSPGGQRGVAVLDPEGSGLFRYRSPGFEGPPKIDVVGCVDRACRRRFGPPRGDLTLTVRSEGLGEGGLKLGFGSSGAVAAVVARALAFAAGVEDARAVHDAAQEGHREAQGGRGSGADVATSCLFTDPPLPGSGAPDRQCAIFERAQDGGVAVRAADRPVALAAVWTGREADTRALIDAVSASARAVEILEGLVEVSRQGAAAWVRGDGAGVLEAAAAAGERLAAMGRAAGAPIWTPEHEAIAAACPEGVVAKPSGAGGGDMAVLLALEEGALVEARARLAEAGYGVFIHLSGR